MKNALSRVFEIAGCRTQLELAAVLGIRQSSISDAKRRNSVPAEWLVTLLRLCDANPDWVLTGKGPKYLMRCADSDVPRQDAGDLRSFSSKALTDELLRRTAHYRETMEPS